MIVRYKKFDNLKSIRELVDFLPNATFVKDADSKFLLMNKACEAQLGVSFSELKQSQGN